MNSALKASGFSGTYEDSAGNSLTANVPAANFTSKDIRIDARAPNLMSITPDNGATNVSTSTSITLVFDETLKRDNGSVTIERKYKSFPALMSKDLYNFYLNKIPAASRSVYENSYEFGTNGLTSEGQSDRTGKYILKYSIDHVVYAQGETLTGLAKLFDDAGYNKTVIDINSSQVTLNDKTVTVQPFEPLAEGID